MGFWSGALDWLRRRVSPPTITATLPAPPPPLVQREVDEAKEIIRVTWGAQIRADVMASLSERPVPHRDWKAWKERTEADFIIEAPPPPTDEEWDAALRGYL